MYAITDGKFALVNGQPDSVDCLATFTAIIKMPGVYFDCDFSVASTMRYQGP